MRIILTIIFLSVLANVYATKYYVSNGGSDSNSGTSTGASWQHISKINSFSFASGDSVFLNRGDTWNEELIPPNSNIYIGAYGTGNNPILSGFQTLTGWTNVGNIWSSTFTNSVPYQNTVLINGNIFAAKGRYPNNSYLIYTATDTTKTKISGGLSGTPNYTGAEVVLQERSYIIRKSTITSQSGGTINFWPPTWYSILTDNWGYFIQNTESVLDTLNEWCFDSTSKTIKIYASSQPSAQASSIDTLIFINKDSVTIENISLIGANTSAIEIYSCSNAIINNCDEKYCGGFGVHALKSDKLSVKNTNINYMWNGGIMIDSCIGASIYYDSIRNISGNIGMQGGNVNKLTTFSEGSGFETSDGIRFFYGKNLDAEYNYIDSVSYLGIGWWGDSAKVKYNWVSNFCLSKYDGGGIYTFVGPTPTYTATNYGSKVIGNLVSQGGTSAKRGSLGIYFDYGSRYITSDSNTVFNNNDAGLYCYITRNITERNNTLFNNYGSQILFSTLENIPDNMYFTKNSSYSNGYSDELFSMPAGSSISNFGTLDSNYYSHPNNVNRLFNYGIGYSYSLPAWVAFSGKDSNSVNTPTGVASDDAILIYNQKRVDDTVSISKTYIDIKGNIYDHGSIILKPFTSLILFTVYEAPPGKRGKYIYNRAYKIKQK